MPILDPIQKRAYQRKWIAQRKSDYFKGKICVLCGSDIALELDHIDPEKKVSHSIWSWSLVKRLVELAKCQILCSICHRIKTNRDNNYSNDHGSYTMYKLGCRCNLCRNYKGNKITDARRTY